MENKIEREYSLSQHRTFTNKGWRDMRVKNKKVGFIGLGVMGKSLANHLLKKCDSVFVYNRTKEKANELVEAGAKWCHSPQEIAEKAELIFTMIGTPKDVESVYLGEKGLIHHGQRGTILVDMTTSTPTLAKKLYKLGLERGIHVIDAPVSGGDIGAKNANLTIMGGGDEKIFKRIRPYLLIFGQNIIYHGSAGAGQHTKMCNQIAVASNMMGITEAIVYARKAGLNPQKVLESISAGAAGSWSLSNLVPRILANDFAPGFMIEHFVKDMKIAIDEAESMGLDLPGLAQAKKLYDVMMKKGEGRSGTQALIKYWDDELKTNEHKKTVSLS